MLACVQRTEPRNALYMAALTAIRRNPPLAAFYKRVRDRGNPPKPALVAVMRKLVALADAPPLREPPLAGLRTLRTWSPRPSSHSWKSPLTSNTDAHLSLEATPSVRRISRCKGVAWRLIAYSIGCRRPDAVERASSALLLRILWAGSVQSRSCQDTSLDLCFNAMKVWNDVA